MSGPTGRPLQLVFAGTPHFAALHLKALIESEHQLLAVYTQPDRPAGRGKKLRPSPVKQLANEAGLTLCQPGSLRNEGEQQRLRTFGADALVVVAYGLILPQPVLDTPPLGCINVHASLLPRWRGAAPIQRAIEAGDATTGITIMEMDAGLDTGAMLATATCPIDADTTAASLESTLAELGPPLLLQVLHDLPAALAGRRPQDETLTTYAAKILKPEAEINWAGDATDLDRAIRAFNPVPVCFSTIEGERVKVWQASPVGSATLPAAPGTIIRADRDGIVVNCGSGQLAIQRLQLPGGRPLTAIQILNARADLFAPGKIFSPPAAGRA